MSVFQHLAAILPSKGSALEVKQRPTPTPGLNDLLTEVNQLLSIQSTMLSATSASLYPLTL